MTKPELPRLVEQTRALLLLQMYMTLLVLFFMTFLLHFLANAMGGTSGARFYVTYTVLVCIPIVLGISAMMFRRGMALGWMLALVTELATLAVAIKSIAGQFTGLAAIILLVVGGYATFNLFRPEVRRHFFG
ncbi:hypothetical protein ODJ79_12080 [Actinoplanes sp. KI2]|uniref:hypothetical protein n=1 Tax=Actinoplanes sp. KI2 TaxID=2983315 RepID=UPI0021D57F67|nr:hypothetical protein [Actinoplanes sp. KI2]MCU7724456.1 hypothetical protein [Actinoplanes sp. KI2]